MMRLISLAAVAAAVVVAGFLIQPLSAQDKDVFAFIPAGGRTLLAQIVDSKPPADQLRAMLTTKHTRDEWLADLKERAKTISALQKLDDKQMLTLADYLSANMPLAANQVPADPARTTLPLDGRDLALEKCQGCHIITVVVTQSRSKEAWLGTMHKPSHIGIRGLSEAQREQLANYLVINAGIPIDQVPEELRAGGASY